MQDITIREATEADLPGILHIYAQPELDNGTVLALAEAREQYRRLQHYPSYYLYVATVEEQIVGTFALLIMDNLAHLGAPSGVVEDVGVLPAYQGQGIGRRMMAYALDLCRRAGCYKLTLSSNLQRTQAHAFYASLGFQKHGFSFRMELQASASAGRGEGQRETQHNRTACA
jgi:ribosomal protein S18 acetylase RimI-like enzyme